MTKSRRPRKSPSDQGRRCSLAHLARQTAGQDLAEYGIALAIIAVAAGAAAVVVAGDVQTLWTTAQGIISSVL
jgi:Flp pilus assembly pilin Flp